MERPSYCWLDRNNYFQLQRCVVRESVPPGIAHLWFGHLFFAFICIVTLSYTLICAVVPFWGRGCCCYYSTKLNAFSLTAVSRANRRKTEVYQREISWHVCFSHLAMATATRRWLVRHHGDRSPPSSHPLNGIISIHLSPHHWLSLLVIFPATGGVRKAAAGVRLTPSYSTPPDLIAYHYHR